MAEAGQPVGWQFDPPISEPDIDQNVRFTTREQRLKTIQVLKTMYGDSHLLREAEAYLTDTMAK